MFNFTRDVIFYIKSYSTQGWAPRSFPFRTFRSFLSTPLKICVLTVHALVMIYTQFHCIRTKTFCLSAPGINSAPPHFLGSVTSWKLSRESPEKNFGKDSKRAAVELWRAGVPLGTIRKQLKMSESTLRRILAFARKNPTLPV